MQIVIDLSIWVKLTVAFTIAQSMANCLFAILKNLQNMSGCTYYSMVQKKMHAFFRAILGQKAISSKKVGYRSEFSFAFNVDVINGFNVGELRV